jgi:malonyl-CoA O-methyltransferase
MDLNLPGRDEIRQTFDAAASRYDRHAALEQEVGARLMERLEFLKSSAERIVDLGCGTGLASAELKRKFRKAQVIGLDCSRAMLAGLLRRSGLMRPLRAVCSDYATLPFAAQSLDLVFSNLAFQWCAAPAQLFSEVRRVLKPGGMLLFSTLGIGTLQEPATAWLNSHRDAGVAGFLDILELGDALMAAGFQQPVMDAERLTLNYPDVGSLVNELEATGMARFLRGGNLSGSLDALEAAFQPLRMNDRYPVSFEVVYGTAYGPEDGQPRKTAEGDVVTFSVDSLRRTRSG